MAITKEKSVDSINVLLDGQMNIREVTKILEDGVQISFSYTRYILVPGADLTGQPTRVTAIANATWTDDVIDAYNEEVIAKQAAIDDPSD